MYLCLVWLETYIVRSGIGGHIVYSPHFTDEATKNVCCLARVDRVR